MWLSRIQVVQQRKKQLDLKRVKEFVCDVPCFHPTRAIRHRLAKIRHPSCSIFHGDSWDLRIEKHASDVQREQLKVHHPLPPSDHLEATEITPCKSKNTQTWTLSPLKRRGLPLWRESQYSRNVLIRQGRDASGKRWRMLTTPLLL